jgi:hypothetical protein
MNNNKGCNSDSDCDNSKNIQCVSNNSYYNNISGRCICKKPEYNEENVYSFVRHRCKNPCEENPCGNRGECVPQENGDYICKDCIFPYVQDSTNKCTNLQGALCETGGCFDILGKTYCLPPQ